MCVGGIDDDNYVDEDDERCECKTTRFRTRNACERSKARKYERAPDEVTEKDA